MTPDAVFIALMLLCALAAAFVGGCIFQNWRAGKPVAAVAEDPYETIHMPDMSEVAATTAAIELVAYLPPILEPTPQPAILQAPILLGDVPLLAMTTDRDRWRHIAQQKDRLRARYLRLLRAERARLGFMFHDLMDAPRRPTKAKLSAVILDLPRGNHLRLVPPAIANGWAAA